jgi:hypothetical protein
MGWCFSPADLAACTERTGVVIAPPPHDEFIRHHNALHDTRAAKQLFNFRVSESALGQLLFRKTRIHANLAPYPPINLDHDFDLLFFGEVLRILRPLGAL